MHWYEDSLLGESIHNNKDRHIAIRGRELFNKVHGNGVPRFLGNRELLQHAIRFVLCGLGSMTIST